MDLLLSNQLLPLTLYPLERTLRFEISQKNAGNFTVLVCCAAAN